MKTEGVIGIVSRSLEVSGHARLILPVSFLHHRDWRIERNHYCRLLHEQSSYMKAPNSERCQMRLPDQSNIWASITSTSDLTTMPEKAILTVRSTSNSIL
jgi:hypothetical protein